MRYQLPSAKAIKDLFEEILGMDVTAARAAPPRTNDLLRQAAALYVEGGVNTAAVAAIDVALAAHVGAAMSLVSRAEAESWVNTGVLPPDVARNTEDLFETMLPLLEGPGITGIKLYQTFMPGGRLPADVSAQLVATAGTRIDLELAIARHGRGRISFVTPYVPRR